ncbi:MAG TPA: polysaccharide biosynthesis protein [Haloplasmataceae bacterium]
MERSLVKSAFRLTAGVFISRIIGMLYVFLFARLVVPEGLALYSYAYIPYGLFLDLATLGIPTGMTRLIAEQREEEKIAFSAWLYRRVRRLSFFFGVAMFLTLFWLSFPLAHLIVGGRAEVENRVEDVRLVIQLISLALLIIPNLSLLRGIFNGLKRTSVTAFSQVFEQIVRVGFILISAYVLTRFFDVSYRPVVALAVLAASLSGAVTWFILSLHYRRLRQSIAGNRGGKPMILPIKRILAYALPAVLITFLFGVFNLVDTLTFNRAFSFGGHAHSEVQYATYTFEVQKLVYLPLSLGVSFGTSFMVHGEDHRSDRLRHQITQAIEMVFFVLWPIILLLMVFSKEVYHLLFGTTIYGPQILFTAAPLILPFALLHLFSGIMQRLDREWTFIRYLLIGVVLKVVLNIPLLMMFETSGAILSSYLGFMVPVGLSGIRVVREQQLKTTFMVRRLVALTLIGIILSGLFWRIKAMFSIDDWSRWWQVLAVGGLASLYSILYLLGCYGLGVLDCLFHRRLDLHDWFNKGKRLFIRS